MSRSNFDTNPNHTGSDVDRESTEEALIRRAQTRDLAAFNHLVLLYQNLAFSVAYRLLHDEAESADAVQESLIKAFRALPSFYGGSFKSWLMRIVVNTCYDELRVRKRRATDSLDDLLTEPTPLLTLGAPPETPEEFAERRELNAAIEQNIAHLPDDQRLALILCDLHGYTYEEMVEITGWPMGTVKSRINRARIKLRDLLLQQPELLPPSFRPKNG